MGQQRFGGALRGRGRFAATGPSGEASDMTEGLHPTRTALRRVSLLSNQQHAKWIEIKAKSS